jgi:uncharacterized membrane protein
MSSFVIYEALAVGFKESFKIGIVWLVFYAFLVINDRKTLLKPFVAGIISVAVISLSLFFLPHSHMLKEYMRNFVSMSFAFFLIASVGALLNASGVKLFEPVKGLGKNDVFVNISVLFATIFFFLPDITGAVLFVQELSVLTEQGFTTFSSAIAGFLVAGLIFAAIIKYVNLNFVGSFFGLPQILLFLAIVKLLGGGAKGLTEISLIPSVQRGLMKFSHDVIHQMFVLLMVPDHPLLRTTVWDFIGIFFGPTIAYIESLLLLLLFPLMFVYYSLFKPLPEPEALTGAERRKKRHTILSERRRKALPVAGFVGIIFIVWFSQGGETVTQLYNPKPRPVVEDKGMVMIPLKDPSMDLMDGALHKFSLSYQGEEIKLLIIRRSDNTLSVCLDACEICPPEGYAQREGHVVCIYCQTPILIDSLGEQGGCNPIPLKAEVEEGFVKIDFNEIVKKWKYVKSGKSKEVIQ